MEVYILSTCSPQERFKGRNYRLSALLFHQNMHVTAKGLLETLYTAISIKVVGSIQAYKTRPKGSVGSCKSVLVLRLSAVGQELQIL